MFFLIFFLPYSTSCFLLVFLRLLFGLFLFRLCDSELVSLYVALLLKSFSPNDPSSYPMLLFCCFVVLLFCFFFFFFFFFVFFFLFLFHFFILKILSLGLIFFFPSFFSVQCYVSLYLRTQCVINWHYLKEPFVYSLSDFAFFPFPSSFPFFFLISILRQKKNPPKEE